jgi:hypothetical protein
MRILVATCETQGHRASDFNFAQEGETVVLSDEHDGEDVDGACGCQRSLVGIESGRATTTMRVIEAGWTRAEFYEQLREARQEYLEVGVDEENIIAEADYLLAIAERFSTGAVIERRGGEYLAR